VLTTRVRSRFLRLIFAVLALTLDIRAAQRIGFVG
jgi:hypothetical protein